MNICIFGDSITWGAYDPQRGGWANRLRNHFEGLEEEQYANIYNLGINGDTITDLLKRIEVEAGARIVAKEMSAIVFAIGTNDARFTVSNHSNQTPEDDFKDNLEKLYAIAKKFTSKVVFVGLTPVDESKTNPVSWNTDWSYLNEDIKRFNRIIEEFCLENNLKFIPVNDLLGNDDLDDEDGLHPNTQGHAKMFEKIKPEIEAIVGE